MTLEEGRVLERGEKLVGGRQGLGRRLESRLLRTSQAGAGQNTCRTGQLHQPIVVAICTYGSLLVDKGEDDLPIVVDFLAGDLTTDPASVLVREPDSDARTR